MTKWFCFLFFMVAIVGAQEADSVSAKEITITVDDSIRLATDLYLPDGIGKIPCVLVRTPYNKDHVKKDAAWFLSRGLAVVAQDCRGKFKSEGVFYPFVSERTDGLATLRWIRNQPWSDGRVAGWGGSYVGYTQWAIADSLDAMVPLLTSADIYELVYPGGLFSLHTAFVWGLVVASQTVNQITPKKLIDSFSILPLSQADDSTVRNIGFIDDWIRHEQRDAFWQKQNHRRNVDTPMLSVAGWYDIFLLAQLNDFKGAEDQYLLVGPWCHGQQGVKIEYGGKEKTGEFNELGRAFLVNRLQPTQSEFFNAPFKARRYNLFIMERNEYVGADQWPPKATEMVPFYLDSGKLVRSRPSRSDSLSLVYDPADPFPSLGGTALGVNVGPALQNPTADRTDQWIFEKEIEDPLTLLGPISARLFVNSDAPCTDFIVGLQDVFPNGDIINIQEGGVHVKKEQMTAGVDIPVWATGYQLNPGHTLRVVITSSRFPRFNRSLNTCEPIFTARSMQKAHQTLYTGGDQPSTIFLPVFKF